MTMYQEAEKVASRRRQTEQAIQLAMESRWEEAVAINRAIISLFPNDADSYNRLGKALMELARFNEAKKAYRKAMELDPTNQIAKKNLERINAMAKAAGPQVETIQMDPTLFIEEMGKSAVSVLQQPVPSAVAKLTAGDRVELRPQGTALAVETPGGELIGLVEPKLGLRLVKLMKGGNQYVAGVTSLTGGECRIIIKETYQHPSQAGRPSFPTAGAAEGLRPYTKERLLRREGEAETEAEEEGDEEELGDEEKPGWDGDSVLQEGDVRLYDAAAAEEAAEDEIEE
jgi:hypothetical protein